MAATSDQNGESTMTMTKRTSAVSKENQMQLACPRCNSTNTKFCYYNNYNFSQPRHFCKSCRRYWTHGGALRDIPVGGGSRRSSTKRPRTTTTAAPPTAVSPLGSFGSLLGAGPAAGFLAFAGFGLGFEGVGSFGMGRGFGWSTSPEDGSIPDRILVGTNGGGHTWQFDSGGIGGGVGSDCFPWPADLAIPTSGHGLKLN